ncbi:MAG TPA: hydroxymethylbilane synthase [Nitrososphaerales archaeon]
MNIIVGARGSSLSLIQTGIVVQMMKKVSKDLEVSTQVIKTKGDIMDEKHILTIGGEGIFEKEVNNAVIERVVDFAVHSMKDLTTSLDPKLTIAAIPIRESPFDVLVSKEGYNVNDIPSGSTIGTGSPRREAQVKHLRQDLVIKPIRGNVETRLRKLDEGEFTALIMAEAGLNRLKMQSTIECLPSEDFTPAAGQGALAITIRKDREDLLSLFSKINHAPTMSEVTAERRFLAAVGGGCKIPIGAWAKVNGGKMILKTMILSPDGGRRLKFSQEGSASSPEEIGDNAAQELISQVGSVENMVGRVE